MAGADLIFDQQRPTLRQTPCCRDVDETISRQDDGTPEGNLRPPLALLFLVADESVGY